MTLITDLDEIRRLSVERHEAFEAMRIALEFDGTLTDEGLRRVVEFTLPQAGTRTMVVGELLQHATTHGVHHRGQLALLLRVLGRAPGQNGLWLAFGHGHWGLTLGPVTGRLIADMMTGATPFADPAPYRAERFH